MRAIDAAVADYAARKDQHLDVEEWKVDGKPLRVHWQLLTIEQRKKVAKPDMTDVDVLIKMARDANGDLLFSLEDKPKLKLNVDASIVTRIAAAILGVGAITQAQIEDEEKN